MDLEQVQRAGERFAGFFRELEGVFLERSDVLAQISLALLAREHVLLTGPPGTAKSQLVTSVLGRILDESNGAPSVYARLLTESTVQTDLVGPIDFKTLMETGRTEHFTDEGMLGAVHAFLDEVLDGRDMLLRATLNVLQERELKQGAKTKTGRIECALMTTNRYLAEVLDQSRETLLAFVDRVAFVGFVPKGFADGANLTRVLRAQTSGGGPPVLRATLTIQDLDVLQAAADETLVPDEVCAALASLLEQLEVELASAARADPSFVPTRYLSTRAAVRSARILRAATVYDRVMSSPTRPLEARVEDLGRLRLSLLLSGPTPNEATLLLARESDARERRQLGILRTEREIFDRCLGRLPRTTVPRARASIDVQRLEDLARDAVRSPEALVEAAKQITQAADTGTPGADRAAKLLESTIAAAVQRALGVGLTAGTGPADVDGAISELDQLAIGLESANASSRPIARWLRGRALALIDDAVALGATNMGQALEDATGDHVMNVEERADARLGRIEQLATQRARLRAAGAIEPEREASNAAWQRGLARAENDLVALWDAGFRDAVAHALAKLPRDQLGTLLVGLAPTLRAVESYDARLAALGGAAGALKSRVVGPRMAPLVSAALERMDASDRVATIEQVSQLMADLGRAGLADVQRPSDLLSSSVQALTRAESAQAPVDDGGGDDLDGYLRLRRSERRVSLSYTMVEIALRVSAPLAESSDWQDTSSRISALVSEMPEPLREQAAELDLARVERAVARLERWWAALAAKLARQEDPAERLATLTKSTFFRVTRDQSALVRFALEARLVGEVFATHVTQARALRERVEQLEEQSARTAGELLRARSDAAWVGILES